MEVKTINKPIKDRSHPHPLKAQQYRAQLPSKSAPTKKLSRGRSPKKYASKIFIPSKNINQFSNKVLTTMKTYGIIEM